MTDGADMTYDRDETYGEDWVDEPPRRGRFGRLLAPEGTLRPATTPIVLAVLGAVAFLGSLTMTWQMASIPTDFNGGERPPATYIYSSAVTSSDLLGLVYVAGMLVLLSLAGMAVSRSDLALRLRVTILGPAIGLLGIVLGVAIALPRAINERFGLPMALDLTLSYEPGLLCAIAAVIVPVVAIWLASRSAVRATRARVEHPRVAVGSEPSFVGVPGVTPLPAPAWSAERPPRDLTVTPER